MFLTSDHLIEAFGIEELLQIAGTGGRDTRMLDLPRIEEATAYAEGLAVGYVIDRWPAAVAGTPLLISLAADIARWRLRGRGGQQAAMNDAVQKRYEDAIARLKDIGAGRLTLDLPAAPGGGASPAPAAVELAISASVPPPRAPSILGGYR